MSGKPVRPRTLARRDVEDAVAYYAREATADIALRFIDTLEGVYRAISTNPAAGSPRYGAELNLSGLRSRLIEGFPYIVFYLERDDHIDVWRILHRRRNIPAMMEDEG